MLSFSGVSTRLAIRQRLIANLTDVRAANEENYGGLNGVLFSCGASLVEHLCTVYIICHIKFKGLYGVQRPFY